MERKELIILGAGLSGLSTALHRGGDYLVLEREGRPGGLTRTEDIEGFLFNHTGHWLHLRDPRIQALVADLLPGGMVTVQRRAAIWSNGVFTLYPFQANLHGLPREVLRECLQGAVAAAVQRAGRKQAEPRNFLEYAHRHFGDGIARHFIVPYNTKLWGVSPAEVTAEWTQRFVPIPDIAQIVDGALGLSREALGYNASFLYPAEGGIETLARAMYARLDPSRFLMNTRPRRLSTAERWVEFGGERVAYGALVSTLALPDLVELAIDAPDAVRDAARRLRCSPLRYVNVALDVPRPLDGNHWIYLPEARYPFYRVGSASNALPGLAPAGRSSLYVELANDQQASEPEVVASLAGFLKEIGSIEHERQIRFAAFREHPWGYVIFDRHCADARAAILDFLASRGVHSIGRYGGWTYNSMEDAILDGLRTAESLARPA
jgi:protoporphyrinogen oxidase